MVITPLNTAVIQGSDVTLQCRIIGRYTEVFWYNSLCATTSRHTFDCEDDGIYYYRRVRSAFRSRFNVTESRNYTHFTADLNIYSTELADAGVYLCAEQLHPFTVDDFSSAQLIVLGDLIVIFYFRLKFLTFYLSIVINIRRVSQRRFTNFNFLPPDPPRLPFPLRALFIESLFRHNGM